jgi:AraC family transcriptional regulator
MVIEVSHDRGIEPGLPTRIIHEENPWLARPRPHTVERVSASRWSGAPDKPYEASAVIEASHHVVAIALRSMKLSIFSSGKLVHAGRVTPGMVRINQPSEPLRTIFHGDHDILHLYIPNALFADCVEAGYGRLGTDRVRFGDSPMPSDPVIDRLARAFIQAEHSGGVFGYNYAEGVTLAIVARILGRCSGLEACAKAPGVSGLAKWRLKRAIDYIEAHLGDPIGLTEMAAAAGLSRMHFAAQFRVATGMRPHEYLLRRRTERAQNLLSASSLPLVEIALEVGFKSQSHFTTVFTGLVGKTPKNWRQQTLAAKSAGNAGIGRWETPLAGSDNAPMAMVGRPPNVPNVSIRPQNGPWPMFAP